MHLGQVRQHAEAASIASAPSIASSHPWPDALPLLPPLPLHPVEQSALGPAALQELARFALL